MASEPGSFNGDLFVASGAGLWRMDNELTQTSIYSGLFNPERGVVRMAITAQIGDTPEYMFIADGRNLFVYVANGYAHNTLTGTPANGDVVRTDTVYYQWTNASVDAGSPDGTSGNPWLVDLGATSTEAFTNIANAINASGVPGTDYSTALTENPYVLATNYTSTVMSVRAKLIGTARS